MSADAHPPAPAAGGSKLLNAWGVAILVIVLVFANVLGVFSGQLNTFLQVLKFNGGVLLAVGGVYFISKAMSGK